MRLILIVLGFMLIFGCVSDSASALSDKEKDALDSAIDDEYKARATYKQVIADFEQVKPFTNILAAEGCH